MFFFDCKIRALLSHPSRTTMMSFVSHRTHRTNEISSFFSSPFASLPNRTIEFCVCTWTAPEMQWAKRLYEHFVQRVSYTITATNRPSPQKLLFLFSSYLFALHHSLVASWRMCGQETELRQHLHAAEKQKEIHRRLGRSSAVIVVCGVVAQIALVTWKVGIKLVEDKKRVHSKTTKYLVLRCTMYYEHWVWVCVCCRWLSFCARVS